MRDCYLWYKTILCYKPDIRTQKVLALNHCRSCAKYQWRATILPTTKEEANMSKHYIPVPTSKTTYYEPKTEEEQDALFDEMQVGDMLYNKWVFNGLWYTMGLLDESDPTSKCLFPNILLDEPLPPLTRWGIARMNYLKEHRKFQAAQYDIVGLHKHCLEIEEQAKQRKERMMAAIRKDPTNFVTEQDKAKDPIAWVARMNNFQASIHETIYSELIHS